MRRNGRKNDRGMALVVVIMALTVIAAFVVEFTYSVYVDMHMLNNWREGRRLATLASSGAAMGASLIARNIKRVAYNPQTYAMPGLDPFDDGTTLDILVVDEDSKFNLNGIAYRNGQVNEERLEGFRRLLNELDLNTDIADYVADWLDEDGIPMAPGSEEKVRNGYMTATDELLLVRGIDRETYDTLERYVTVHSSGMVNINAAEAPVLVALSDKIDGSMAQRVVNYRDVSPFTAVGNLRNVAGFENLVPILTPLISVKGASFRIMSTAHSEEGLTRAIDCVVDSMGIVKFWKEY